MKKTICKVICFIMCVVCLFSIYSFVEVITEIPVFVNLSSIALIIYGGIGMVSAIIAFITGKIGWHNKK